MPRKRNENQVDPAVTLLDGSDPPTAAPPQIRQEEARTEAAVYGAETTFGGSPGAWTGGFSSTGSSNGSSSGSGLGLSDMNRSPVCICLRSVSARLRA
jgi:hypothetical protein